MTLLQPPRKAVCLYLPRADGKILAVSRGLLQPFTPCLPGGKVEPGESFGCKGILVSHSMLVSEGFRGRGIAKRLQGIKEKIALDLQASMLLATVKDDNQAEKNVIQSWEQVSSFTNKRTSNKVNIYVKKIQ